MRCHGTPAIAAVLLGSALPLSAQVPDSIPQVADSAIVVIDTLPLSPLDSAAACLRIGTIGSITEDHARVAQLSGAAAPSPWLLRRSDPVRTTCTAAAGELETAAVQLLPVSFQGGLRTGYDGGRNDGALWQAKGVNTAVSAGVRFQFSVFTLDFAPVLAYQQNADLAIVPVLGADTLGGISPFANPWFPTTLDIPQRFGGDSFTTFDLGQSRVSALLGPVEIGLSNQSLWWGPGVHNALLMTNTAPGFPHVHVSSARPLDLGLAHLEFTLMAGQLRKSGYQDTLSDEQEVLFRGLAFAVAPRGLDNLYLGMARSFVGRWEDLTARELLEVFVQSPFTRNVRTEDNPSGNSPGNQLLSFFARWVMPANRFEIWTEWGREDHAGELEDLLQEPDHSQGWVIGFQKLLGPAGRPIRVGAEWTDLSHFTPPRPDRGYANWYTHAEASYTHEGQWLGTATGTSGDSQHLWADAYWAEHSLGLWLERVRRQDHAYYLTRTGTTLRGHDVELTLGVRGTTRWRGFDLEAAIGASNRYNRSFIKDYGNLDLRVGASWWPQPSLGPGVPAGE